MVKAGDTYDRELKGLLVGDEKIVGKMVKTCSPSEKAGYETTLKEPFLVTRSAGSLGIDLVAMRWDFSFPIEVKSSGEDVMHFSRSAKLTEQADFTLEVCVKSHLVPLYAFRLKGVRGDPWRIFTIPTDHQYKGRQAILARRLPKFDISNGGNYIMRWENGMKLSDFLSYVSMSDYSYDG